MKKIFYCLVAAFVLAACVKEDASIAKVEEVKNPYAVTPDEAVQLLKTVIGGESTRAVSVGEIKTLRKSDFVPITRGAEDGDVIYIVDLENGGCAVMGADKRMEPIYAILDETKISPEKLTLTATRSDDGEEDIEEFVMGLMNAKISSDFAALRPPLIDTLPIPSLRSEFWNETTTLGQRSPMLRTKWDQEDPYNNVIAMHTGNPDTHASCVTIAMAQLMAYHQTNMRGTNYNWNIINSFTPGYVDIASDGEITYLANYIFEIRRAIKDSDYDNPNIPLPYITDFMSDELRYNNVSSYLNYNRGEIVSMLNNNLPVCVDGETYVTREDGSTYIGGHSWLIDGYNYYKIDEWERSYFGEFIDEERIIATYYYDLMHCNYGWEGKCDGYYSSGIFNPSIRLNPERIDTSIGDKSGTEPYNFNINLYYFKYSI